MAHDPGTILVFLDNQYPRMAWVQERKSNTLQVRTDEGQRMRLPARRVRYTFAEKASGEGAAFDRIVREVRSTQEEVDTEFLWEMLQEDPSARSIGALTMLYFGSATGVEQTALFRALLDDSERFQQDGETFRPLTQEEIEAKIAAQAEKEAREAYRERAAEWIARVLKHRSKEAAEVPDEMAPLCDDLLAFLKSDHRSLATGLLEDIAGKHDDPRELAFEILLQTHTLDPATDDWLMLVGIDPSFPDEALAQAAELEPYTADPTREDLTDLFMVTIDDASTRDMDDALSIELLEDGHFRLGIHIADPGHFVPVGSPLDAHALQRGLSVYLPTGTSPMFPRSLAHEQASLVAGELRPTLSFFATLDDDGNLLESRITRSQVRVGRRLTYDDVDAALEDADQPLHEEMTRLARFSEQRMAQRLANGAFYLSQPEMKFRITEDALEAKVIQTDTAARRIVSEAMILANTITATFAQEHEIPVLYRAQDGSENPDLIGKIVSYDPVVIRTIFRGMKPSRFTEYALPHSGLGVDVYTQVTSPIRRFADMVLQRQLSAYLTGGVYPYAQSELLPVLSTAEAAERASKQVERRTSAYWSLAFLQEHYGDEAFDALVIYRAGGGFEVELVDYPVRGFLQTRDRLNLGDVVSVRIKRVNPKRGDLRLEQVVSDEG